jgi:hypothetical protein
MTFKGLAAVVVILGASIAGAQPISQEQVSPLYAAELGSLYHPADLSRLYAAHQLIEQYFAAVDTNQRNAALSDLAATNIDPAIIGRLTRIRLGWAELAPGVYYVNEKSGPYQVRYFLGVPKDYQRSAAWPLVIKLPTPNAFVGDQLASADEVVRIYTEWITEELEHHPDALVLMPLFNLSERYGPSIAGMNTVIQPLLNAAGKVNIDPARVYMLGHSMAAQATWAIAMHYPTYFAAINPLAGEPEEDWTLLRMVNLRNTLIVAWHDDDDLVMPVNRANDLVSAMRKLKMDVEYFHGTGVGHAPSSDILRMCYGKMRARIRYLYPPRVSLQSNRNESFFNRNDWVQVYQELEPGPVRQERTPAGELFRMDQNAYSLDARIDGNTVQITADNVWLLRLYFNDQMVDLSKPIVVTVNGREKFRGLVSPSLEEMLKDQRSLGRGWRYYTAILDLDLSATPTH